MGSLTEQAAEEMGGPLSVLTRQRRDHARLDRMPGQLPQVTGADEDELLNRICRLAFSHAFAEESVLWPALRRHLPDGTVGARRVERQRLERPETSGPRRASSERPEHQARLSRAMPPSTTAAPASLRAGRGSPSSHQPSSAPTTMLDSRSGATSETGATVSACSTST